MLALMRTPVTNATYSLAASRLLLGMQRKRVSLETVNEDEKAKELKVIQKLEDLGQLTPREAMEYQSEITHGFPKLLHFTLARLALLPALAIWATAHKPGLLPAYAAFLMFPLLILWVVAFLAARPPRTLLGAISAFLSGPILMLAVGVVENQAVAEVTMLYCTVEVLAMPLGSMLGLWVLPESPERLDADRAGYFKVVTVVGCPVVIAAVLIPSTGVQWSGLPWPALAAAAVALFSAILANARMTFRPPADITPAAFRSAAGVFWLSAGFLVLPVLAMFAGALTRTLTAANG